MTRALDQAVACWAALLNVLGRLHRRSRGIRWLWMRLQVVGVVGEAFREQGLSSKGRWRKRKQFRAGRVRPADAVEAPTQQLNNKAPALSATCHVVKLTVKASNEPAPKTRMLHLLGPFFTTPASGANAGSMQESEDESSWLFSRSGFRAFYGLRSVL